MTDHDDISGFFFIDKPKGITSYDVIRAIKPRLPKKEKIGHSGTLDPFATGLMIIAVGRDYTKQLTSLIALDKIYMADITLGVQTDSYDCDGAVTQVHPDPICVTVDDIQQHLRPFQGVIEQRPPRFSAKKIRGRPAYDLARRGIDFDLQPTSVTIHDLSLIQYTMASNVIRVRVHCSKGTYIRSLAHDIGQSLGCGAHVSALTRWGIGSIDLNQAVSLSDLTEGSWHAARHECCLVP